MDQSRGQPDTESETAPFGLDLSMAVIDRATRIAAEYDKMKNDPQDPEVKAAYDAMIHEYMGQWRAAMKTGLKVEFIPEGAPDPYAKSPRLMT